MRMINFKTKRKPLFRCVALAVAMVPTASCGLRCPEEVNASIGVFDSKEEGLRASIPKLAAEIHECPDAELYRIMWKGPDPDENQRVDQRALLYDKPRKRLGYEHDVGSGIAGRAWIVDRSAIQAVAQKGGVFEDFAAYDQK